MKSPLLIILLGISVCTSAQFKHTLNTKGFNSCFQKMESGHFIGYAEGNMQFEYKDGTRFLASFSNDSAYLDIVPDPHKIYDISYKNYSVRNKELQIEYGTYSKSNALSITIGNKIYIFSLFDGASISSIDGIDYEYMMNGSKELLKIHFSDKVALYTVKNYTSMRTHSVINSAPGMYVLKGSTLIFSINTTEK